MLDWLVAHKLPLGLWIKQFVDVLTNNAQGLFDFITDKLGAIIDAVTQGLLWFPPLVLIAIFGVGTWILHRSIVLAISVVFGLLLIVNLGYWQATVETLSLVLWATL